jgi:hypothetical protein
MQSGVESLTFKVRAAAAAAAAAELLIIATKSQPAP